MGPAKFSRTVPAVTLWVPEIYPNDRLNIFAPGKNPTQPMKPSLNGLPNSPCKARIRSIQTRLSALRMAEIPSVNLVVFVGRGPGG